MLRKILDILRKEGILGLISAIKYKLYPKNMKNYRIYFRNLRGKFGLEIGGLTAFFKEGGILPIYKIVANLNGCNFSESTIWEGKIEEGFTYKYHKEKKGYQFISDAVDLRAIKSETYDFVLSSHTIEHIANPLRAISDWLRVLKDEGILLLVVPHRDGTFDHNRPVTLMEHLIDDYKKNIKEDDLTHLDEILDLHDLNLDPLGGDIELFRKRSLNNYENRCLHHHVFNTELVIEIFDYFNLQIISVDVVLPWHIFIIGKKLPEKQIANNDTFLSKNAKHIRKSPFVSDKKGSSIIDER